MKQALSQYQIDLLATIKRAGVESDWKSIEELFGSNRGDFRRGMEHLQFALVGSDVKLQARKVKGKLAYKLIKR